MLFLQWLDLRSENKALHTRVKDLEKQRQLSQRKARDSLSLGSNILESVKDAVLVIDAEKQQIDVANSLAEELFKRSLQGKSIVDAIDNPELIEFIKDSKIHSQDITEILVEISGEVIRAKVVWIHDLENPTQIVVLQNETRLQQLGRARHEMVANISHELRTPVTSIGLLVDTLLNGAIKKPRRSVKIVEDIRREVDTITQLVQEMRDLSLIESGQMPLRLVTHDLLTLIQESIEMLYPMAERKKPVITISEFASPIAVLADSTQIPRVLKNIVHNAIKFAPEGGYVKLSAIQGSEEATIAITNDGPSIPEEQLPRIFERFYQVDQARSDGTGLGLAIARHIVLSHSGRIWAANNTDNTGVTFFFTLPLSDFPLNS